MCFLATDEYNKVVDNNPTRKKVKSE